MKANNTALVIMSGKYLESEFTAEFGQLPPSFLPIGNNRLYYSQIKSVKNFDGYKYLSLPSSFKIPVHDQQFIKDLGIHIIPIDESLSLKQSLSMLLAYLNDIDHLHVLYGDTLFTEIIPSKEDAFSFAKTSTNYKWASFEECDGNIIFSEFEGDKNASSSIVSGYFSFKNIPALKKSLNDSNSIVDVLNKYSRQCKLTPLHLDSWMDLGHLQNYYHSKQRITTQREFNQLIGKRNFFIKKSIKVDKIKAEYNWFNSIPFDIKCFTPQVGNYNQTEREASYQIEYLPLPSLNELYVFGTLPEFVWENILDQCFNFVQLCRQFSQDQDKALFAALYKDKTIARITEFIEHQQLSPDKEWCINGKSYPSINKAVEKLIGHISADNMLKGIMHGDLCFSNILYDSRADKIKVIDPRGYIVEREYTCYGDVRYDYAKLMHSIVGKYDMIISQKFLLERKDNYVIDFKVYDSFDTALEESFYDKLSAIPEISIPEITAITSLLFFSMLPLHSDDLNRQLAFLCTAYSIFAKIDEV